MTPPHDSVRATLRVPAFRGLWAGSAVYHTGNAMQVMAASWLMVQLTGSSFLAALVQTAVFLPMFLLALPAGVLADTSDRRRLIASALIVQVILLIALTLLALSGWAGPAVLLLFTFAAGCCTALLSPAWMTGVLDTVKRENLPHAIIAMSMAWNSARALGPAIAGVVFAWLGAGWVFAFTVASALTMLAALRRWPPPPHAGSALPAERLWSGTVAALRYARHSPMVFAQLVRTVAYGAAGSALWGLLPAIAAQQLRMDAAGFGSLMGALGIGAVGAGLVVGQLRRWLGLERLVTIGCALYAAVMLVAAFVPFAAVMFPTLAIGGAAWMVTMSTFNTATQSSAPPWIRSRAVALHTLSALGSFALGSAFWGAVSGAAGLQSALVAASVVMAAGIWMPRWFPLRMGSPQDVTPVTLAEELFMQQPAAEAGPVAVEVIYRVRPGDVDSFLPVLRELRTSRRRDGATLWRVYRDLADPTRFVERFTMDSWAHYLHQRARATLSDEEVESRLRGFLLDGEVVRTQHYIEER